MNDKMQQLAHEIHGLNIRIDQCWRIADDSKDESVAAKAKDEAQELVADLQVAASDLADLVLGVG